MISVNIVIVLLVFMTLIVFLDSLYIMEFQKHLYKIEDFIKQATEMIEDKPPAVHVLIPSLRDEYFPPCESGDGICNSEDCAYYDRELCTGDKDD